MGRCSACKAAKTVLACCLGHSPPRPAPAAPAPAAPAPPNGGATANRGDGILLRDVGTQTNLLRDVGTQTTSASANGKNNSRSSSNASDRPRPVSLPAASSSEGQTKKGRVSCRPQSVFFGDPPSPPPKGPLPPIPEYARRRNSQHPPAWSTTSSSQHRNSSQKSSNSKQATDLERTDTSEQLLSKSQLSDSSQQSDISDDSIDSEQLDELLQIDNPQQTGVSHTQFTCILEQLDTRPNPPTMESVILHPLPIISIGDYVTRHKLREQPGPVVGALFGQQNGREITVEFAYEVQTLVDGDQVTLEPSWFETRLEQSRS